MPGVKFHNTVPRVPLADWLDEARRRYGDKASEWKFVCPICGNVQSCADLKAAGADPEAAYRSCLGRFVQPSRKAIGENAPDAPEQPCNYTINGLFSLPSVLVVDDEGKEHPVFAFAE